MNYAIDYIQHAKSGKVGAKSYRRTRRKVPCVLYYSLIPLWNPVPESSVDSTEGSRCVKSQ